MHFSPRATPLPTLARGPLSSRRDLFSSRLEAGGPRASAVGGVGVHDTLQPAARRSAFRASVARSNQSRLVAACF